MKKMKYDIGIGIGMGIGMGKKGVVLWVCAYGRRGIDWTIVVF